MAISIAGLVALRLATPWFRYQPIIPHLSLCFCDWKILKTSPLYLKRRDFVQLCASLDLRNYRRQCQYILCCYHERMTVKPLISHHGVSIVIKEEILYVFMSVIGYRNMQFSPCLVTADSDCAILFFLLGVHYGCQNTGIFIFPNCQNSSSHVIVWCRRECLIFICIPSLTTYQNLTTWSGHVGLVLELRHISPLFVLHVTSAAAFLPSIV